MMPCLQAIFKAMHEDTVPESYVGIYSSGKKDRMGCDIPKVVDFTIRSLPIQVQDDLMRAEILPTMWPRYIRLERVFHYRLMTVIRRAMIFDATCHTLTPGAGNNMYPPSVDNEYRKWINELMHTLGGHPDPVQQLVVSAYECAIDILNEAGSFVTGVDAFNAYQLGLFLFKDMGIGGTLSKFIGRMNDPDIGGFTGFSLTEPIATWYQSFYDDYKATLLAVMPFWLRKWLLQAPRSLSNSLLWPSRKLKQQLMPMIRLFRVLGDHDNCRPCGTVHQRTEPQLAHGP